MQCTLPGMQEARKEFTVHVSHKSLAVALTLVRASCGIPFLQPTQYTIHTSHITFDVHFKNFHLFHEKLSAKANFQNQVHK